MSEARAQRLFAAIMAGDTKAIKAELPPPNLPAISQARAMHASMLGTLRLSPVEAALYGAPADRAAERRRASFDAEKFDAACERAKAACRAAIAACNEQVEISRAAVAAYEEALEGFDAITAQRGGQGR